MKYRYLWAIIEILIHFTIYYFNLRGTLLGKILVPYRYAFIMAFILLLTFFMKKKDLNELVRITFYANLIYLICGVGLNFLIS